MSAYEEFCGCGEWACRECFGGDAVPDSLNNAHRSGPPPSRASEAPSAPLPEPPTTEEANAQLRAVLLELLVVEERLCATIRAALSASPERKET